MEVILVRVTKNGSTTPVPLKGERTLVGRLDDCQIRVPAAGISRKHCEILVDETSIVLNDLGSSNGTYVNQDRITSQPLCAGDLISFGGLVFLVSVNGEPGDIDAQMMFEDGLPDEEVVVSAQPQVNKPVPVEKTVEKMVPANDINDDSSMMDFDFSFDDDDDDQPPL